MFTPHVILLFIAMLFKLASKLFKRKDRLTFAASAAFAAAFAASAAFITVIVTFAATFVTFTFVVAAFAAGFAALTAFVAAFVDNDKDYKIFSTIFYITTGISIAIFLITPH